MARTYKVYGCAHDASGSLDVTLSVGGSEVFNGSITVDTAEHTESPLEIAEIFTFDVDDSITGNQAWSMTITGSADDAEMHVHHLECNNVRPNMTLELEYFTDKIAALDDPITDALPADVQTNIATTIGETALGSTVYNKLIGGTSVPAVDAGVVMNANEEEGKDANHYYKVEGTFSSVTINDEAYAVSEGVTIPMISGDTLALTWDMTPTVFAYDPPLPA